MGFSLRNYLFPAHHFSPISSLGLLSLTFSSLWNHFFSMWGLCCIFDPFKNLNFFPLCYCPGQKKKKSFSLDLIHFFNRTVFPAMQALNLRVFFLQPNHPSPVDSLNLTSGSCYLLALTIPCSAQNNCFSSFSSSFSSF